LNEVLRAVTLNKGTMAYPESVSWAWLSSDRPSVIIVSGIDGNIIVVVVRALSIGGMGLWRILKVRY
jgi:hypothetical protein